MCYYMLLYMFNRKPISTISLHHFLRATLPLHSLHTLFILPVWLVAFDSLSLNISQSLHMLLQQNAPFQCGHSLAISWNRSRGSFVTARLRVTPWLNALTWCRRNKADDWATWKKNEGRSHAVRAMSEGKG